MVPVDGLLLGTGGGGAFIPGVPPTASVFFDDVSVTIGPDTFVFDITVEASSFDPGGPSSVAQTAAGLGVPLAAAVCSILRRCCFSAPRLRSRCSGMGNQHHV